MSSVVLQGDSSGSITIQAPNVAGSTVLSLPSTIGSSGASAIVTTDASGYVAITGGFSTGTTNSYVRVNQAYLSSGGDYCHLANNAWYNGSAWTTPANGAMYQMTGQAHNWYTQTSGAFTLVAQITSTGVFSFNSGYGASATAYGCRAWVKFAGATGVISGSGGVTSVTRTGTGAYTVNLTNAMPDTNFATVVTGNNGAAIAATAASTTTFTISTPSYYSQTVVDTGCSAAVFR